MKRSELRADPEKIREFVDRNRKPLKRKPPKRRDRIPATVRKVALGWSGGRCIVCRRRPPLQGHHVLPVRMWPEHTAIAANIVPVCPGCHDNHERAHRRIRYHELPSAARKWVYTLGGREQLYLERTYPR